MTALAGDSTDRNERDHRRLPEVVDIGEIRSGSDPLARLPSWPSVPTGWQTSHTSRVHAPRDDTSVLLLMETMNKVAGHGFGARGLVGGHT